MSIEAINWALNHAPIPTDRKDASTLAITLLALANHAGPDGRDAYPSVDRMMRYTRLSRRTVQRSLRSLEELGLIRQGNTRVRDAHIPEANSRPQVYNLVLSTGLSTDSGGERRHDAPLTSRGRQQKRLGASAATSGGVSMTHKPSFNRPRNHPASSAPDGRSTVPSECGQCDARPGDPISARVIWLDHDHIRSTPCPRCAPQRLGGSR
ncbi:helix-turn-helix domain-containing protein [Kibdelosporangium philippinense]|uniref:Helix-turn-helix domain-containing protein n=1 Tax=Kibdelosporangium philippinense TaxID=211113 RepID=A0ABS8ZQL4_9PSEU|nr:helix-turn-helix domain-containing protein [Kibdelosporangium philippinense]MCE7010036.1 helix-turn-helix domain-containing protein [Kibdelosporangium philippinense]